MGVNASYYVPLPPGIEPDATTYEWKIADSWSSCSAMCAVGKEY